MRLTLEREAVVSQDGSPTSDNNNNSKSGGDAASAAGDSCCPLANLSVTDDVADGSCSPSPISPISPNTHQAVKRRSTVFVTFNLFSPFSTLFVYLGPDFRKNFRTMLGKT